ncbi:MAG: NAD(+) synthase [Paludibacteraceae bacterium]|nr:NAD(+) synthase [Paludibacteraceae bacterium]
MKNYGYIRVASAIPTIKIADCHHNADKIIELILKAKKEEVEVVCFPELVLTGYTCNDLFFQSLLLDSVEKELFRIMKETKNSKIVSIIGTPLRINNKLYNVAVVCQEGKIIGIVPKSNLQENRIRKESIWFSSGKEINNESVWLQNEEISFSHKQLFGNSGFHFAVEIGNKIGQQDSIMSELALEGADILFNPSASNDLAGNYNFNKNRIAVHAAENCIGVVSSSVGFGESTTDLVFGGSGIIYEMNEIIAEGERFSIEDQLVISEIDVEKIHQERLLHSEFKSHINQESIVYTATKDSNLSIKRLVRPITAHPFHTASNINERCEELFSIQVNGLATRLHHTGIKRSVIGISGGLDSTLALLVAVKTYDKLQISRKEIYGITMPGFGTTGRTYQNALQMMKSLGISTLEIPIKEACLQHFKDINHNPEVTDTTFENAQARERTQILMDYSNKINGLVIGTGDLSEIALGWATYNGDHISMYSVNANIPKTLVRTMVEYVAKNQMDDTVQKTLMDVIATPVSPELLPCGDAGEIKQKTEDVVGPYELHDFFLYYTIRYGFSPRKIFFMAQQALDYNDETLLKWMRNFFRRFFTQQFKRSCMPDGPKVGSVGLSPRGDWSMPSDATAAIWLQEIDDMINEYSVK